MKDKVFDPTTNFVNPGEPIFIINDVNGENANYRLYPPRNQNKAIVLYFERISGR